MEIQTTDNLIPLLHSLQQPAFCLRDDGTLTVNRAARHLAPRSAEALPQWFGNAAEAYRNWDHSGTLTLPLELSAGSCSVTIHPLQDGMLFLMTDCMPSDRIDAALATASQVLRQPLADLSALVRRMEEELPEFPQSSAVNRHLCRLSRIAANLADLERLHREDCLLRWAQLDVNGFLQPLLEEAEYLFTQAGKTLLWTLPARSGILQADSALLERAIFNLMSNALKFSPVGAEIRLQVQITPTHLQLRLENPCGSDGEELLRAAFTRLEQRDMLPDPRWGIGLGLPLVQAIARQHGGTVAIDTTADRAAVILSIQRRHTSPGTRLESPPPYEYGGGTRRSLLELSDALPSQVYHRDAL